MATITITIPDALVGRVLAAIRKLNPDKTPKQALIEMLIEAVKNYEADQALTNARFQAIQKVIADFGAVS